MKDKFPTDPSLRAELSEFRAEQKLTYRQLAKMLSIEGATETFLGKYINDNLDRTVEGFEAVCRDLLKSIRDRIAFGSEIFETSVTRKMGNVLNLIRKTGDIALLTSPAGHGKTSAIKNFAAKNPSAILVTLNATTRAAKKVEGCVFKAFDNRDWKGRTPRFDYMAARFKDSSRLLIIDNAQRLDTSGRQWLFDFQDETGAPIALIGNPEAIDLIRANDQQFSRIGISRNYELESGEIPAAAHRVAAQFSDPDTAEKIGDLVAHIATHEGRLRAVRKTVILAQELRASSPSLSKDPRAAIRAAHTYLVRDYELPAD